MRYLKTILLILALCAVGFLFRQPRTSDAVGKTAFISTENLVVQTLAPSADELAAVIPDSLPEPPVVELFSGGEKSDVPWTGRSPAAKRVRKIFPDTSWMTPEPVLKAGDIITLALFDDAVFEAEIRNVTRYPNGAVGMTAHLQDGQPGTVYLSYSEQQLRVSVELPGADDYYVRYNVDTGEHYAVEVDTKNTLVRKGIDVRRPPVNESLADSVVPSTATEPVVSADAPAGSTLVDVMIVYTPAALSIEGNVANMNANVAEAMQRANEAHTNSNTQIYLRLVHSAQVNYIEANQYGDFRDDETDLNRLTNTSDGYMDDVHTWRNTYGADFVCLFSDTTAVGGLGWLLESASGWPDYAFCLAWVGQTDWTYTMVHEWGHNMGCGHSKTQSTQQGPGLYSYSAGWQWSDTKSSASIGYCSVMTYENFDDVGGYEYNEVAYFSNPSITYTGNSTNPTGDSTDGDNARTMREMKTVLAGYRTAVSPPTVTLSLAGSPMAEAGGAAILKATLSGIYPQPVTVNLAFSGTASWPNDYTRSGTNIVIATGSTNGTVTLTAVQDTVYEGNETITVDITVLNGTESGTQQVTATITDDDPAMSVAPAGGAVFSGLAGGVISPASQVYALTNAGAGSINWTASRSNSWLVLSATGGTLAAGGTTNVTVSVNADALTDGSYSDVITFSNTTYGVSLSRAVSLTITPIYIYFFSLDTYPGWAITGQWAFGHPAGLGGATHGGPDPSSGATGTNVFGVNLAGDYSTAVGGPYYLKAGPFDFSDYTNIRLYFQRWLNTEFGVFAPATVEISSNGTAWTQIYFNEWNKEESTSWSNCQYDISSVADRQATVYVRWGYQIKAQAQAYSGWNIDDIGFSGDSIYSSYAVAFDAQGGTTASPSSVIVTNGSTYGTLAVTARAGYTFDGWWTGAGGSGAQVTSATPVALTGAQTLYAKWTVVNTTQGTPCPWLDQYGLVTETNYEAAALADEDGDGFAAWQEYIAGSNPTNSSSFFGITSFDPASNGFVVGWNTASGRVYSVDWAPGLTNSFQALETNILWPQASYTDTVHDVDSRSFYQINVRLAP